jgi:pyruvate kinase
MHSVSKAADPELSNLAGLAGDLQRIERRLVDLEATMRAEIDRVPEERRESARNLVHYVALRQVDLRDLQGRLADRGLSSIGRSESSVLANVIAVSRRLQEALACRGDPSAPGELRRLEAEEGRALSRSTARELLRRGTRDLLGPRPTDRHVHIMVTAPSAAEADSAWMSRMLRAHMGILRINGAHEGPDAWRRMIAALDAARRESDQGCRVLVDLAGPKIRTGPIRGGRRVVTWKVAKDDIGRITAPATVLVRPATAPAEAGSENELRLPAESFATLRRGDRLAFVDARGKQRSLVVRAVREDALVCDASKRAYVLDGTPARARRRGREVARLRFEVPERSAAIDLKEGEELVLTASGRHGAPARRDARGRVSRPAIVACTLPAALEHLVSGHRVLFDDGRVECVVVRGGKRRGDHLLRVVRTQKPVQKLRAEKGINLPDTPLSLPALTNDDLDALTFVAKHADAVSLSFVRRPADLRALREALAAVGRPDIGVVLKIETRAGFENLPRLLLEGLRHPPLGVMIARGDLAVEVGYERLAEVQEEILWLCEASHVPAIWATQVLDTLSRTGAPSRAEVTDAAAGVGAECVMLNKGPHVDEAARLLAGILRRMEAHHDKKRSLYRKLHVSTFAAH